MIVTKKQLRENAAKKIWSNKLDSFTLNEKLNITKNDWHGTYIKGGKTVLESVCMINDYIDECDKPIENRNLSFIHLA